MFPIPFVRHAIEMYCPDGGSVLDPFCGRGTVPFVARVTGRKSLGVDLNPVAFVFSSVKLNPEPNLDRLLSRIGDIAKASLREEEKAENSFQAAAWSRPVLRFLKASRRLLDWRNDRTDQTLMALILVHLHGKTGNAVSNQMRQSKSMSPNYSIKWWKDHGLKPPQLDPVEYFCARARWRYRHGIPTGAESRVIMGDARTVLPRARRKFSMLLTSPPYYDVTNYRLDNWIRLWMLGEEPLPNYTTNNDTATGNDMRKCLNKFSRQRSALCRKML
jgi:hypothetical protein